MKKKFVLAMLILGLLAGCAGIHYQVYDPPPAKVIGVKVK